MLVSGQEDGEETDAMNTEVTPSSALRVAEDREERGYFSGGSLCFVLNAKGSAAIGTDQKRPHVACLMTWEPELFG